jgi:hypothetical protein
MTVSILMSAIGIFLNTLGVFLIFHFGISPYLKEKDSPIIYFHSSEDARDKKNKINRKKRRFSFLSRLGLWLCLFGGILQIIALFVNIFFV